MTPPTHLIHASGAENAMQLQLPDLFALAIIVTRSAGLLHSAAEQILMIASGNHTIIQMTPPYER